MAARLLLVVEDTFAIAGRGLAIAPAVDLGPAHQHRLTVELRRADGTITRTGALAQIQPRLGHVLLVTLGKTEVPIGTEVWSIETD